MQVNFNTNKTYKPEFGNQRITEKALIHLKTRYMSEKDIDCFEKILKHLDEKGELIECKLDEHNGDLVGSISSAGRYSETKTEDWFSHLFLSPIHFIRRWSKRADKIEQQILNDIKLENLAQKNNI